VIADSIEYVGDERSAPTTEDRSGPQGPQPVTPASSMERKRTDMTQFLTTAGATGASLAQKAKDRFDDLLVRYDAWFLVFIAVLLALGATLLAGMAIWCVVNQQGRFTGSWQWENGIMVNMECVR
jgi:hypothetical protein